MERSSRSVGSPLLLTRIASFVAIGLVSGYALAAVPNVELVSAVFFWAGFLMVPIAGIVTGVLTEALFAGFHPMGSSFGVLLVSQVIGMAAAGMFGAIAALLAGRQLSVRLALVVVGLGVLATLIFDLVTNLAYPIAAGFTFSQLAVSLSLAVPFAAIHIVSNAFVFALLVVPILPKLKKVLAVT